MSNTQLTEALCAWPHVRPALFVPQSEDQYNELVSFLDRLIDEVRGDENHPLASLMDVVGVLIEKYEDEHVPVLTED